jgi:integrase
VQKLKEPQARTRVLDAAEEMRLLAVCREPLRSLVMIGLHTGIRIAAEGLPLQWNGVDLRRRTLTVEAAYAKNSKPRLIPLTKTALDVLGALKGTGGGAYVFGKPNGERYQEMEKPFRSAVKFAGLARTGVTLHTLRHTWATRLVESGCDLRILMDLGGWSDLSMVQRYSHPGQHRVAIEKLEEFHNAFHNTGLLSVRETGCA